jgi:hypothetical protein
MGEERQEITDKDKDTARDALAQLKRDLEEYKDKPFTGDAGKFTGPIGVDDEGRLQKPLTPEEMAHKEEIRRRARGEQDPQDSSQS